MSEGLAQDGEEASRGRAGRGARLVARAVVCALGCVGGSALVLPARAQAQRDTTAARPAEVRSAATWRSASADSLVQRAIARRGVQLADSTLLSYTADAHGFLAFLVQLGEGVLLPPKVVQSEELALTIAWWQPGRSAQQLVGRRDTTLLPADVAYYRDRYGVVLDNLPDRIRLGDGQDVRDVPHPLAANAAATYEYAMGRPLTINIPGRTILVDEVKFRPRDAATAAAVGSVYLDRESAAVVRLSMTFTRAAILDKRIETLVVTLENGLVRERYWLPRRQEVEVSRGSTWLDLPVRGVVRGKWEIAGYTVNERIADAVKTMPRWSSKPKAELDAYTFPGRVIDVLPPELQIATREDVVQARVQAEAAVRASMLARPATAKVATRGISDFARFTRAEGLALGLGGAHRTGQGVLVAARARYGFADEAVKGHLSVGPVPAFGRTPRWQLFAEREYRDLAFAERAGVTNSLASALFASDYTQPVDTRAAGLLWRSGNTSAFTWRLAAEDERAVLPRAHAATRTFAPTLLAWRLRGVRGEVQGTGGWAGDDPRAWRGTWQLVASAGGYRGDEELGWGPLVDPIPGASPPTRAVRPLVGRAQAQLHLTRPLGGERALFLYGMAGVSGGRDLPPQWLVFAGGPWSAPGYDYARFGARALVSARAEVRLPTWGPSIPLGRFGASPPRVTLAPFVQAVGAASGVPTAAGASSPAAGVYPSVGTGVLLFYDLLRVDVARGLRQGTWRFGIDIDRGFWGIL
ncbi:MAG: hypothetical protein LCH84_07085 [Gemmatimonadetes bacterium]|nr:hypothetical protein [Gemmatimonadota bacterium]